MQKMDGADDHMNVDVDWDGKEQTVQNVCHIQDVKMVNAVNHGHATATLVGVALLAQKSWIFVTLTKILACTMANA
jgi:hypothetical protein